MAQAEEPLFVRIVSGENKLSFPLSDCRAGKTISNCVDHGSSHIHQGIYLEQEREHSTGRWEIKAVAIKTTMTARGMPVGPLLVSIIVVHVFH